MWCVVGTTSLQNTAVGPSPSSFTVITATPFGVSAQDVGSKSRQELDVSLVGLEQTRALDGQEVVGSIRGLAHEVGVLRSFDLRVRGEVARVRKLRYQLAFALDDHRADVVPVTVRGDNVRDVSGLDAGESQRLHELGRRQQAVDLAQLVRPAIADPDLDDGLDVPALDEEGTQRHQDGVVVVGRRHRAPQIGRDDAPHRPAVESKEPVRQSGDTPLADLHHPPFPSRRMLYRRHQVEELVARRM